MEGRSYSSGFRQLDQQLDQGFPAGTVVTLVAPAYTSGELVAEEFALDDDHQTVYVATQGDGLVSPRIRDTAGENTHVVRAYSDLPGGLATALSPSNGRNAAGEADGDGGSNPDGDGASNPDGDVDGNRDVETDPRPGTVPNERPQSEDQTQLSEDQTDPAEDQTEPTDDSDASRVPDGGNEAADASVIDRPSLVVDTANGLIDRVDDVATELAGLRNLVESRNAVCLCHLQAQLDDLSFPERTLLKASDGVLYYDHNPESPDADRLMVSEFRGITLRETRFRLEFTRGTVGINADREF